MADDLIPLSDLVSVFKRSKSTLYRWAQSGAIPARRVGSSWYIHRADVARLTEPRTRINAELDARRAEHGVILSAEDMSLVVSALQDSLTRIRHARRSDDGAS